MRIGILGTGNVGQSLGTGFATLGHEVKMGSRDPNSDKVKEWVEKNGDRASAGTFSEAAAFAEVAVIATLWGGAENAIALADPQNLAGKVVIDVINPLLFKEGEPPSLAVGHTDSAGEQVQRWLPDAYVVKAFNTVGSPHMFNPQFPGGPPDMFICGEDSNAKKIVAEFCEAFGWSPIDIGGIQGARILEPMCILWVTYGIRTGTWNHAFKLLRK